MADEAGSYSPSTAVPTRMSLMPASGHAVFVDTGYLRSGAHVSLRRGYTTLIQLKRRLGQTIVPDPRHPVASQMRSRDGPLQSLSGDQPPEPPPLPHAP